MKIFLLIYEPILYSHHSFCSPSRVTNFWLVDNRNFHITHETSNFFNLKKLMLFTFQIFSMLSN